MTLSFQATKGANGKLVFHVYQGREPVLTYYTGKKYPAERTQAQLKKQAAIDLKQPIAA